MNEAKLARMANQVAAFFRSYPEDEAVAGVRGHLQSYWTRGMIRDLRAHAMGPAEDVDTLVARALTEAPLADNPAHKTTEGPEEAGALVTDAG